MAKHIFDQDRPRSTMAQRLDEAFAGCDEWTVVAAPRRRNTLAPSRRASAESARVFDGLAEPGPEERHAA